MDDIGTFNSWSTYDTKKKGTSIAGMTLAGISAVLASWCPGALGKFITGAAAAYFGSYIGMSVIIRKQMSYNYNGGYKVGMRTRYDLYTDRNWTDYDRTGYTAVTTR